MPNPDQPLCLATRRNAAGSTCVCLRPEGHGSFHLYEHIDGAWLDAVEEERRERRLSGGGETDSSRAPMLKVVIIRPA